ncbi:MAG: lytic transglycosylase domain-containing protein [Proteobacteria bacterium]|nr:lytic transglycosylase domain-containing protein [Pseudomonadota bacterium]MDA0914977.1 lytic transglycosylase domain-containing protein [Pseudomonadota bacterium]MDA1032254.1 lytic transglycosylase domain-containing protein [Pseudomonadota bacterium]
MNGRELILFPARGLFAAGLLSAVAVAAPAQADVMEIGSDGAHWIAGGPITQSQLSAPLANDLSQAIVIPDRPKFSVSPVMLAEVLAVGVPQVYSATVADVCTRYDLSPALLEALVWQESRWRHRSISPKGARGLAQLMPATARYLGVDPDDPHANLEGGARYLRIQLNRFDGDLVKALAAYNAGPGRVERANGVPQIRETQNYVRSILGRLAAHHRHRQNGTT